MADTNQTENNTNSVGVAQSPIFTGRRTIYWEPVELTDANVLEIVEQTMLAHEIRNPINNLNFIIAIGKK